jgi:hypothetical protein
MKTIKLAILGLTMMIASFGLVKAQEPKAFAANIIDFTKIVEWPSAALTSDFIIAVVGETSVYPALIENAIGKTVNNQKILIRKFKFATQIERCNILFVPKEMNSKIDKIVEALQPYNTLIVCEQSVTTGNGSAITFVAGTNKLSFEINTANLESKGLKMSANAKAVASAQ